MNKNRLTNLRVLLNAHKLQKLENFVHTLAQVLDSDVEKMREMMHTLAQVIDSDVKKMRVID